MMHVQSAILATTIIKISDRKEAQNRGVRRKSKLLPRPQFEFITSTGPLIKARDDEVSSYLVRRQAMRSFLKKKDISIAHDQAHPAPSGVGTVGKFKLINRPKRSSRKSMTLTTRRGAEREKSRIDFSLGSFQILSLEITTETRRLLHHCRPQ
ncbi:hypothetical protein EJ08DRAFT_28474 [Tothia fuscella]|uniref:Uncharacterized protein n=1 Tax=Tothia fuscella TaxID=1048955 RepID=A0A9P4NGF2_9PEZI|nr:hypothetical protein EJ08DRAFT_28474 [Tothia fuscella]